MLDVEIKKSAKRQEDRYETEEYFLEIFDIASQGFGITEIGQIEDLTIEK